MNDVVRLFQTEDDDPLNDRCDACGADPGEQCREWCLSWTRHEEGLGDVTGSAPAGTSATDAGNVEGDVLRQGREGGDGG